MPLLRPSSSSAATRLAHTSPSHCCSGRTSSLPVASLRPTSSATECSPSPACSASSSHVIQELPFRPGSPTRSPRCALALPPPPACLRLFTRCTSRHASLTSSLAASTRY
uniref:Uncharacterized protein n=1 Tax=Haptolina brevifila TaxID=156173 RepID=A0A7S2NLI1_9EUKA